MLDGGADTQWEEAIFGGCLDHSKALGIFAAAITAAVCCKRDHSVAINVMQQKGPFNMPGKRK